VRGFEPQVSPDEGCRTILSKVPREEAAHCRRLAELVTEHTIRQDLMEMAARLQALADEIDEP
jgi:hypothetical protein